MWRVRATYRCDKCGMKIVLSEGATYCPNCGGRLRIILSSVGRAKRSLRMTCAMLCGVWAVKLVEAVQSGAEVDMVLWYAAMLAVSICGSGLIKVKVGKRKRAVRREKA